ncbi:MAG: tubulin-like doman-containing protein [Thermoplasmatota archaeon]
MTNEFEGPANPRDDINRIIIGLGGQGSRVVNEVRKEIERQGAMPVGLEFIAVDSDRSALANLDSVPERERIHLAAPDDNLIETIVPWLPHEFRPKAGGGCGMQRLTGKAMYLVHRNRVLEAVRDVARRLRDRTQVSDFMIVLVTAFGGGTGSGMLIDFALDARSDLKEITGQQPMMFGIGILPSRAETIQRANGVAMLKELHFLLSHKEPIVIDGRDYSSPFELYFLVGREVMGIERDDELLQSIVRFTHDLGLIPSLNRDNSAAGKGAGWVDLQDIRTLVKGAGHMFSTFGHYRAVFPDETLRQWFDVLDKGAALRKELPTLITDLDTRRKSEDDKKIALAHDEEVFAIGRERAARLRADGVMGANRPELARLLMDLARGEEDARKRRRETQKADLELATNAQRRKTIETELREAELHATALMSALLSPTQTRTTYTVPLSEGECKHLNENRHHVTSGHFASVMGVLGRTPDYHEKTSEVVGKNKLLGLPMLNYRMAMHSAATFPPAILAELRKHGFVKFDAAGRPIVNDENLWMVMAMLSTNVENIDATKVSARAFKEVVEGHIARRAEVKIVPSLKKRFEVVIHSWMVGVQIAPLAPGYPPRLKELEWLMPEYEQVVHEGGLVQHHAFLFGNPLAFASLASTPVDRLNVAETNERVTDFWATYAPIDRSARWLQLPPLVAEANAAAEDLATAMATLDRTLDEFRKIAADAASLDRLNATLLNGATAIETFNRTFTENANPLRDRLSALAEQLEHTQQGPRDAARLIAMEELTADATDAAANAIAALANLRADLPDALRSTLANAPVATLDSAAARARSTTAARWSHLVARAQSHATRLGKARAQTLRELAALERTLAHIQATLSARALAPYAGATPGTDTRIPLLPAEPPASNGSNGHAPLQLHQRDATASQEQSS